MLLSLGLATGCGDHVSSGSALGLIRFEWICNGAADYGCGREAFPDHIAVGSTFEVTYDVVDEDIVVGLDAEIEGASPSLLGPAPDGSGLAARAPGEVALLAMSGDTMIDFTTVALHSVDGIGLRSPAEPDPDCEDDPPCPSPGPRLDQRDDDEAPYAVVEMEPQTRIQVQAVPLGGSTALAGQLEYSWESLHRDRLQVSPLPEGRARLDFVGPSAAALVVRVDDFTQTILVRAPYSDEIPEPLPTGGGG